MTQIAKDAKLWFIFLWFVVLNFLSSSGQESDEIDFLWHARWNIFSQSFGFISESVWKEEAKLRRWLGELSVAHIQVDQSDVLRLASVGGRQDVKARWKASAPAAVQG